MAYKLFETPPGTDIIAVRKAINKLFSEARNNTKPSTCRICGKNTNHFCNSHSVPQMALRSIAENGIVLQAWSAFGINEEIIDIKNGVNKSGTFYYICNECDSIFFQDYENPDKLLSEPTDKMLAEIAVKDFLLYLSKRDIEKELFKIQQRDYNAFENVEEIIQLKEMDIREFDTELKLHKSIAENNIKDAYNIIYYNVLPYTVPVAMQSTFAMDKDFEGVEINNVFNYDPSVRMQYIHLAILPINGNSVIILFYHKRDREYRRLKKYFSGMSEKDILKHINYLVFKYTENYFFSKKLENYIGSNERLHSLSQDNYGFPAIGRLDEKNLYGIGYIPVGIDEIPNFLSKEWALS